MIRKLSNSIPRQAKEIATLIMVVVLFVVACIAVYIKTEGGRHSSNYDTVCIAPEGKVAGHEYYIASGITKGYLANHLDDDGKPIKCTVTK